MLIMPFIERLSQSLPTMRSQWLFQFIYTIDINNSRAGRVYDTLPAKNMEYFLFQRLFAFLWGVQGVMYLKCIPTSRSYFWGS